MGCEKEFQKLCGMDSTDLRNQKFPLDFLLYTIDPPDLWRKHTGTQALQNEKRRCSTQGKNVNNQIIMYQIK